MRIRLERLFLWWSFFGIDWEETIFCGSGSLHCTRALGATIYYIAVFAALIVSQKLLPEHAFRSRCTFSL